MLPSAPLFFCVFLFLGEVACFGGNLKSFLLGRKMASAAVLLGLQFVNVPQLPSTATTIDFQKILQMPIVVPTAVLAEEPPPGPVQSKQVTLPNGVQYFDAVLGTGPGTAEQGKSVQFQWVIRRANGYFVDASSNYNNEPFIYRVGDVKKVVSGLDSAIKGMRVGGVRRIIVPYDQAYIAGVEGDVPGPVPNDFGAKRQILNIQAAKQTIYFEVKLVKAK